MTTDARKDAMLCGYPYNYDNNKIVIFQGSDLPYSRKLVTAILW